MPDFTKQVSLRDCRLEKYWVAHKYYVFFDEGLKSIITMGEVDAYY